MPNNRIYKSIEIKEKLDQQFITLERLKYVKHIAKE